MCQSPPVMSDEYFSLSSWVMLQKSGSYAARTLSTLVMNVPSVSKKLSVELQPEQSTIGMVSLLFFCSWPGLMGCSAEAFAADVLLQFKVSGPPDSWPQVGLWQSLLQSTLKYHTHILRSTISTHEHSHPQEDPFSACIFTCS